MSKLPDVIRQACELAKDPGSCKSVNNGEPTCVIACLYIIQGGSISDLYEWIGENGKPKLFSQLSADQRGPLYNYDPDFLDKLQLSWDIDDEMTNEDLIKKAEELWEGKGIEIG